MKSVFDPQRRNVRDSNAIAIFDSFCFSSVCYVLLSGVTGKNKKINRQWTRIAVTAQASSALTYFTFLRISLEILGV